MDAGFCGRGLFSWTSTPMKTSYFRQRLSVFALLLLSSIAKSLTSADNACQVGQIITKVIVFEYPVYIKTYVISNTAFEVNSDFTMTVENAPTDVDLSTAYTVRRTTVDIIYPSAGTSYSVKDGSPFVLAIGSTELSHRRRQTGSYLGTNGELTSSCAAANTYSLINGQLFVTSNGTTQQYSSSPGTPYELFVPSTSNGSITTTFSLGITGSLLWTSTAFFNGNALFCILPSGSVIAVFAQNAQPQGCIFIQITISDLTSCFNPMGPSGSIQSKMFYVYH